MQDIFKHCTEEGITSVTEIPYFDGDFWPNVIEETIKELDQEKQKEASDNGDVSYCMRTGMCLTFITRGADLSSKPANALIPD